MWGYGLFGVLTVQMCAYELDICVEVVLRDLIDIYHVYFNSKDNWKMRLYGLFYCLFFYYSS